MTGVRKTRCTRRTQLQFSQYTGKKKPCSPPQGTQFWALMRVWEDGTHDFVVPAVRNAVGGGDTYEAALADVQFKLASMVQELSDDGVKIKTLDKQQSAYKMKGEVNILNEECEALGIVMPTCKRSKMLLVTLDYELIK